MKHAFLVALAVGGMVCQVSHAKEWTNEPKTFRSIVLGAPLATQFPECKKFKDGSYVFAPKTVCMESTGQPNPYAHNAVIARVYNLPDIGIGDNLTIKGMHYTLIYLLNGKVEAIALTFDAGRYDSFLKLLTNKYGEAPLAFNIEPPVTDDPWGRVSIWEGPNVKMRFVEFYSGAELSRFELQTAKYTALVESDRERKRRAQEGNL